MREFIQKPLALFLSASLFCAYSPFALAAEHETIDKDTAIQDQTFKDIESDSTYGGRFLVKDASVTDRGNLQVNITGSTFENISAGAQSYGGVIFQQNGTLTIEDSQFLSNQAQWDGGAISTATPYDTGKKDGAGKLIVKNTTFDSNTAKEYSGGAIGLYTEGELSNNTFTNNNAGGHNPADKTDGGGAIYLGGWAQATLTGNTYEGNSSNRGGAIATTGAGVASPAYLHSDGETFKNNSATTVGGAVYNKFATEGNYIANATFTGNKAEQSGGAIYNNGTLSVDNSTFNNNTAFEGGAIYTGGQELYKTDADLATTQISNSSFNNNSVTGKYIGGAITAGRNSKVIISNSSFDSNKAEQGWGGALYSYASTTDGSKGGIVEIADSSFTNNEALAVGAAGLFSDAKLTNVTFSNNKATDAADDGAGAVFLGSVSKTTMENVTFSNNTSAAVGGAIATRANNVGNHQAATLDITSASFENNTAATKGGAIFNTFFNDAAGTGSVSIVSTSFTGNNANEGGALYNDGSLDKGGNMAAITLKDSSFVDNTAKTQGGAIYNSGIVNLQGNNTFSGNMAGEETNDIYNIGTLNIADGTTTLEGGIAGTGAVNVASGAVLDIGLSNIENNTVALANGSTLGVTLASDKMGGIKANTISVGESETDQAKLLVTLSKDFLTDTTGVTKQLTNGTEVSNGTFALADVTNALYNVSFDAQTNEVTAVRKSQEEQNAAITAAGGNSNTANVINAFTSAADLGSDAANQAANIINQLAQTDTVAAVTAAKALAPEEASAKQVVHSSAARQLFSAIDTHINTAFASAPRTYALANESQSLYNSGKNYSVWAQGLLNKSHKEETASSAFTGRSTGLAGGADVKLGEDWIAGLGYAYLHTNIDSFNRHNRILGDNFFLYGQYRPGRFFVQGAFTYGDSKYEEDKYLPGLTVDADYHVKSYAANLSTGYELTEWLTPLLGVRYMNLQQEGYTDSSDQSVSASQNNYLTGTLGAKLSQEYRLGGVRLLPQINAGLAYDFVSDSNDSTVALPNGAAYDVNGERLHRLAFETGASVSALLSDQVEVLLGYDGNFRQDYNAHTGTLKLRYMF